MYADYTEKYMYCLYSRCILNRSACPLVVYPYTMYDEIDNPLTPKQYTVLNGNFMFGLRDFFRNATPA